MRPYALFVRFNLKSGHGPAFDALARATVDGIREHEPETLIYVTHSSQDPNTRFFYEMYQDEAAFRRHEQQPHTRNFLTARELHVESFDVVFLTPGDSVGP
jgi:quinol monooxygenase YgiN